MALMYEIIQTFTKKYEVLHVSLNLDHLKLTLERSKYIYFSNMIYRSMNI